MFHDYINLVKYHELKGSIKVVGVTTNLSTFSEYEGYPFVSKSQILKTEFDFIIAMGKGKVLRSIYEEMQAFGIPKSKLFTYKALVHSEFYPDKYESVKKNTPTIFSNNCWGGMTYNDLGLEFESPLINLAIGDRDYIKFLSNPQFYLEQELVQVDTGFENVHEFEYPICQCGDIKINFIHYENFRNAQNSWNRRKKRINWDNLLVEMYTENKEIADSFSKLSYKKKICFVSFKTEKEGLEYVELLDNPEMRSMPFTLVVNGMAQGLYPYYDALELVQTGKIKKVMRLNR